MEHDYEAEAEAEATIDSLINESSRERQRDPCNKKKNYKN